MIVYFDGCHKLYYGFEQDERHDEMVEIGYEWTVVDSSDEGADLLRELYDGSCSLRFVSHVSFDKAFPEVGQFATETEEDVFFEAVRGL